MKYKCLVLDHDDTVVRSTPTIHYPSFIESMKVLRPERDVFTLEEFVGLCFEPGFGSLLDDELGYNDEEKDYQREVWRGHTKHNVPPLYDGFKKILNDFKEAGGLICVVSHSDEDRIVRDYEELLGFQPDMTFGWVEDENKRKPHPYPLEKIMETYNLKAKDLVMVDDLKPGLDMAKACEVDFVCAGWSHLFEGAKIYMKEHADYYFSDVDDLYSLLFEE